MILIFSVLVLVLNIDTVGDIRYRRTTMGGVAIASVNMMWEADLGYFISVESVAAVSYTGGIPREIMRFKEESYTLAIFPGDARGPFYRRLTPLINLFLFIEQEDGSVYLLLRKSQGIEALFYNVQGNWYDEDRIARDLVFANINYEMTMRVNEQVPIYYGVGMGYPPNYMSILGYEPDNIIAFTYRGEDYFFWYYLSATEFGEIISENIDIEDFI
ncbi:MAG: hypothetical protein FWE02_07300, partial [Defluviitaleaceae bacterium]|nr:hypothetical protein [Defluviitaleaceae bacterium]